MKAARGIDVHSLQQKARQSGDKEAFVVLAKMTDCRIGVGVRLESLAEPTFFIEVLITLCVTQDTLDLDRMESRLSLLRRLKQQGFILNCDEEGCVVCEITAPLRDLNASLKRTYSEVERFVKTENCTVKNDLLLGGYTDD